MSNDALIQKKLDDIIMMARTLTAEELAAAISKLENEKLEAQRQCEEITLRLDVFTNLLCSLGRTVSESTTPAVQMQGPCGEVLRFKSDKEGEEKIDWKVHFPTVVAIVQELTAVDGTVAPVRNIHAALKERIAGYAEFVAKKVTEKRKDGDLAPLRSALYRSLKKDPLLLKKGGADSYKLA